MNTYTYTNVFGATATVTACNKQQAIYKLRKYEFGGEVINARRVYKVN